MGIATSWQRSGIFAAALLLGVPNAFACSLQPMIMSRAQVERFARARYAEAVAVIDAEVEMPMISGPEIKRGMMPMAVLRVIHSYKGQRTPEGQLIPLVYYSSCDISLTRKGERVRILLMDGPELFRASMPANGSPTDRPGSQAEFNAEIDRLVGVSRPVGFAVVPGAVDPPPELPTSAVENIAVPATPPPTSTFGAAKMRGLVAYGLAAIGVVIVFLAGFLIGRRCAKP